MMHKNIFFLGLVLITSCTFSLEKGNRLVQNKNYQEAQSVFQQIAKQPLHPDSAIAKAKIVEILAETQQWNPLPKEIALLLSYIDPEDEWFQKYHPSHVFRQTQQQIQHTLQKVAQQAFLSATKRGEEFAFHTTYSAYMGLLRHFPQHTQQHKTFVSLAFIETSRKNCKQVQQHLIKVPNLFLPKNTLSPFFREKGYQAKLFCILSKSTHQKQTNKQTLNKILQQIPKTPTMAQTLFQFGKMCENKRKYDLALQFYITLLTHFRKHIQRHPIETTVLQLFGQTNEWKGMLEILSQVPASQRNPKTFWNKVEQLSFLAITKKLQQAIQQGKLSENHSLIQELLRQKMTESKLMSLYKLALVLESNKQWKLARNLFLKVFRQSKNQELIPRAWFQYAQVLEKEKYRFQAARWYESLAFQHHKSIIASRAMYLAWKIFKDANQPQQTKRLRKLVLQLFPLSMEAKALR